VKLNLKVSSIIGIKIGLEVSDGITFYHGDGTGTDSSNKKIPELAKKNTLTKLASLF
jgi:hypothetical protein